MKSFIDDNFLLQNKYSERLYHELAADLPVIDYHNHLDPVCLAGDRPFTNITRLWIDPDPYKHRAMRIEGIPETGITGIAPDKEKFLNWARTLPKTLGNPLFHWSCMELRGVFEINEMLTGENAENIWQRCNDRLAGNDLSPISLLKKSKVELLCTSDDLLDSLQPHLTASKKPDLVILPSLRGDSMLDLEEPDFMEWLAGLASQTNIDIRSLADYKVAIRQKLDEFGNAGCRFADHALNAGFKVMIPSEVMASDYFQKILSGEKISAEALVCLKSHLLVFLGNEYAMRSWAMQLHVGAQRHTSSRLRRLAGANGGYASIGKTADIGSITYLLDTLEHRGGLPKVILYTLNPADNEAFASLTGSYTEDGVAGKVQFGPAWWYNDHYEGIISHLVTLANYGLMHHFIGMTTDSRSLMSLSRHEYFRRVLCNLLGEWVEKGHVPADWNLLGSTVRAICYENIKNWITEKNKVHVK